MAFKVNFISDHTTHFMLMIAVILQAIQSGIFIQTIKKIEQIYNDKAKLTMTVNLFCNIMMFFILVVFMMDKKALDNKTNLTLYYAFITLLAIIILGCSANIIDNIRSSNTAVLVQNKCVAKYNDELQTVCNQTNLASVCSQTQQPVVYTAKLKIMLLLNIFMNVFILMGTMYLLFDAYNTK